MLGKDLGKVWSRQKGVKRSNRQKAEEEESGKDGIRTRQGFGELKKEFICSIIIISSHRLQHELLGSLLNTFIKNYFESIIFIFYFLSI